MISEDDAEGMKVYLNKLSGKILDLEAESNTLLNSIIDRDSSLLTHKEVFSKEIQDLRFELMEVQGDLDRVNANIAKLITEFRKKLKKEPFMQFKDEVDRVPFEFFLRQKDLEKVQ